jgi:hypothetical protein
MNNVLENSYAPLYDFKLKNETDSLSDVIQLTEYEVKLKNYAFRLNRVNKEYIKVVGTNESTESVKLILPE